MRRFVEAFCHGLYDGIKDPHFVYTDLESLVTNIIGTIFIGAIASVIYIAYIAINEIPLSYSLGLTIIWILVLGRITSLGEWKKIKGKQEED